MTKRRHSKILVTIVLIVVFTLNTILVALAAGEATTSLFYSTTATAGQVKKEAWHSLTSPTLADVCGGDVGIKFYRTEHGLQNSYEWTDQRLIDIVLYEYDGDASSDDLARIYMGRFAVDDKGIYAPSYFSEVSATSDGIEGHSEVELYMAYRVHTKPKDKSTSIPAGILHYRFWIY